MIFISMAECEQSLALVRKGTKKFRAHQTMSPIFMFPLPGGRVGRELFGSADELQDVGYQFVLGLAVGSHHKVVVAGVVT